MVLRIKLTYKIELATGRDDAVCTTEGYNRVVGQLNCYVNLVLICNATTLVVRQNDGVVGCRSNSVLGNNTSKFLVVDSIIECVIRCRLEVEAYLCGLTAKADL